jgi:hypothetical protein
VSAELILMVSQAVVVSDLMLLRVLRKNKK